jgi:hypothetical protein
MCFYELCLFDAFLTWMISCKPAGKPFMVVLDGGFLDFREFPLIDFFASHCNY